MTSYDRSWALTAGALTVIGLWGAARGFALGVLLAMAVTVAVLAVMWVLPFVPHDQPLTRPLVRAGLVAAPVTWVLMGMGHLAGYVGVVAVLALIALCPVVRARWRPLLDKARGRRSDGCQEVDRGPAPPAGGAPVDETVDPVVEEVVDKVVEPTAVTPDPRRMSDAELCRAWRASFVLLDRAATPQARMRLVLARGGYLDELERRDGDAFRAWLESGARAAGDPSRYLGLPRHDDGHPSVSD